jgi:hypothetical protein
MMNNELESGLGLTEKYYPSNWAEELRTKPRKTSLRAEI